MVVLREAMVSEQDPRRNERTNARAILPPAEQEKERVDALSEEERVSVKTLRE